MKGYVSAVKNGKRGKYGFIIGENRQSYYFDGSRLIGGYTMEDCDYKEEVEFVPDVGDGRFTNASAVDVLLLNPKKRVINEGEVESQTIGAKSIIKYFSPGFAYHMDFDENCKRYFKNDAECKAVEILSKVLYISRINRIQIDQQSSYEYCLAGATKSIKQFVRGRFEFLIVLSYYEPNVWQAKTLLAEREIRKIREISDRQPLPNFYLLISNASTLFDEINRIKGGTNSAVIPFSFEEICKCATKSEMADLLAERFQTYLYENNMLGDTSVIDDDNLLFGDRGDIAAKIVERCQNRTSSGIFGLRRSGKSSVLRATLRRLNKAGIKSLRIESRTLETISTWKLALYDIAKKVREVCLGTEQGATETRKEYEERLKLNSTEEDYERRPSECFVEDVKLYCRNENVFVIAIDEIELITFSSAKSKVWKSLEAYGGFWGALRESNCSLIVSGVNSTINEWNVISYNGEECDNPMYQRIVPCADFAKTYLPTFTDEQTLVMINTLGGYSNIAFTEVYHDINQAFGGQPYAIRQFCSFVYEKVKELRKTNQVYEVPRARLIPLLNEFQNSSAGKELCKVILQNLTSLFQDEYEMLKTLAMSRDKSRIVGEEELYKIDHLQKYGLIDYDPDTGYVSFRLNTIGEYLRNTGKPDPLNMTDREKTKYVNEAVQSIESGLKTFLLRFYSNHPNGDFLCRKVIKEKKIQPNNSGLNPDTCDIRDFFNHSKFKMYLSSLKDIILYHWSFLKKKFNDVGITSSQEFQLYMEQLNAVRKDASHHDAEGVSENTSHAKFSDEAIKKFENAREHLQKFVDSIV